MNKYILAVLSALVGGGLGVLGSKVYFEKKYRRLADEEVASVKEVFARRTVKKPIKEQPASETEKLQRDYAPETDEPASVSPMPRKAERKRPYIISPEAFGMREGYETVSLTCFADGTLADDDYHRMSAREVNDTVGVDAVNHFGEYEPDSVFVRNERRQTDYEILRDEREYEELLEEKPYLREEDE